MGLSVCLSVCTHISEITDTSPNLLFISHTAVARSYTPGGVALCRPTSGFVD